MMGLQQEGNACTDGEQPLRRTSEQTSFSSSAKVVSKTHDIEETPRYCKTKVR